MGRISVFAAFVTSFLAYSAAQAQPTRNLDSRVHGDNFEYSAHLFVDHEKRNLVYAAVDTFTLDQWSVVYDEKGGLVFFDGKIALSKGLQERIKYLRSVGYEVRGLPDAHYEFDGEPLTLVNNSFSLIHKLTEADSVGLFRFGLSPTLTISTIAPVITGGPHDTMLLPIAAQRTLPGCRMAAEHYVYNGSETPACPGFEN